MKTEWFLEVQFEVRTERTDRPYIVPFTDRLAVTSG